MSFLSKNELYINNKCYHLDFVITLSLSQFDHTKLLQLNQVAKKLLIIFFLFIRYWTMDRSLQRRLQKTNYQQIRQLCRDRGTLFEDPDFLPSNTSISSNRKPPKQPILWLRPHVRDFFSWKCSFVVFNRWKMFGLFGSFHSLILFYHKTIWLFWQRPDLK